MRRLALWLFYGFLVQVLLLDVINLSSRAYHAIQGDAEGSYLILRTVSSLLVDTLIIAYLVWRYRKWKLAQGPPG
jgi:hypothetical protein